MTTKSSETSSIGESPGSSRGNAQSRRQRQHLRKRRCEVVTILGAAGIGKSSLVQDSQAEIRQFGYFASAKFDPARRTPFEPLLTALANLLRQIFSESDSHYHHTVRSNLRTMWPAVSSMLNLPESLLSYDRPNFNNNAQGNNGSSDFCHGGANPRSTKIISIFVEVLRILSSKLVCLSLDGIDHADEESLELLSEIINKRLGVMLLLFTCRDQPFTHPSANTTVIDLQPLTEEDVARYVGETLRRPMDYVYPLAIVCMEKSDGNPFFLRQMLELCHEKGSIWYSWKSSSWNFDLDRVFAEFSTEEYSEQRLHENFIVDRLQSYLTPASRCVMAWASLIGMSFSFPMIQKLLSGEFDTERDNPCPLTGNMFTPRVGEDAVEGLQLALQCYIFSPGSSDEEFTFAHDRYFHAAAKFRECTRVDRMHFFIVKTMMKYPELDKRSVFDRARHICAAVKLLDPSKEYRDLLMEAATKAITSGARASALQYYEAAISLLPTESWVNEYAETLRLHQRTVELYWYANRPTDAQIVLDIIFNNVTAPAHRAPSWIYRSKILSQSGSYGAAFAALKGSLNELGLEFTNKPTWEECDKHFAQIKAKMQTMDKTDILLRPLSEDRNILAMGPVLVEAVSSAFWSDPLTWNQMSLIMTDLHFGVKGTFPQCGLGFAFGAMSAVLRTDDPEFVTAMSDYSRELLLQRDDSYTVGRGLGISVLFIYHLLSPIRQHMYILEEALDHGLVAGDKNLVALTVGGLASLRFYVGDDMSDIESYCIVAPEEYSNDLPFDMRGGVFLNGVRQVARALQGKTSNDEAELVMDDSSHSMAEYFSFVESKTSNARKPKLIYEAFAVVALYIYGHYDLAVQFSSEIEANVESLLTLRMSKMALFYGALSLIARLRLKDEKGEVADKAKDLATAQRYKDLIDAWQRKCDINYRMWSLMIQAEICEYNCDYPTAIQSYEKAIDHAQLYDFNLDVAVAFELEAGFFIRRGAKRGARATMLDAISSYAKINANGKVRQLTAKHEWILSSSTSASMQDAGVQTIEQAHFVEKPSLPEVHDKLEMDNLDLKSILDFYQAISSELEIDRLLVKMTQLIHDSAGSQANCVSVVIESDSEWSIAVSATLDGISVEPQPVTQLLDQVKKAVLLYTLRFKEVVFVHDLSSDDRFSGLRSHKSVISLPIIQGKELLGVLYLEGDPNSFTQSNLAVLQLFCNQISISISNALLFRQVAKVSASNASMVETQKQALAQAREAEIKAKKAEAEAVENVRLKEEAAKAKSMFLANVSHELRTPLNGVNGMSELLKQSALTEEQDGFVDSIRVCADTLLTVINDILDFSKLEAGRMKLFSVPLNLKSTIIEVVRALSYTNHEKGLETITDLQLDPDALVTGDPVRLHQIFMNLLNNAYKFTSKGSVTIRARTDMETADDVQVTCSVSDTGIGITQEQASRLFTPFSQADSSTQRSYGGSGLGLSICKSLIDVLNGRIWMESQLGVGTTVAFTLKFPKAVGATTPKAAMSVQQDPMATWSSDAVHIQTPPPMSLDLSKIPKEAVRICIAEDNPINQKIAISFVKKLGFQCQAYNDGQQAVEAMRKASHEGDPFHLTLMDVQMPVLDGYDATRLIRKDQDPNVRQAVVIAMTASAIRGDREKCLEAGMNDYLAKPVRAAVLKSMLDRYLSGKASETANAGSSNPADKENGRPTFTDRMQSRNHIKKTETVEQGMPYLSLNGD